MTIRFLASENNLNNIPHMLRHVASDMEAEGWTPRTVLMLCITDGNTPPDVYCFGSPCSRLEEVGALASAMELTLQTSVE